MPSLSRWLTSIDPVRHGEGHLEVTLRAAVNEREGAGLEDRLDATPRDRDVELGERGGHIEGGLEGRGIAKRRPRPQVRRLHRLARSLVGRTDRERPDVEERMAPGRIRPVVDHDATFIALDVPRMEVAVAERFR